MAYLLHHHSCFLFTFSVSTNILAPISLKLLTIFFSLQLTPPVKGEVYECIIYMFSIFTSSQIILLITLPQLCCLYICVLIMFNSRFTSSYIFSIFVFLSLLVFLQFIHLNTLTHAAVTKPHLSSSGGATSSSSRVEARRVSPSPALAHEAQASRW